MHEPLKRHKSLQPVSREHHHGLLLSWKIREGFKRKVDLVRIKNYADWFWTNHLKAHFEFEEKFVFPIMEKENELIKRALRDHRRLKLLFNATEDIEQNLKLLEEELVAHIRFEERVLFGEIQKLASKDEMKLIEEAHSKIIVDEWEDEFWLNK